MNSFVITLVIGLFCLMLFFNVYFRVKVFKHYKYLVQNKIEFSLKHMLDGGKMRDEILQKYPQHQYHILAFTNNIRNSLFIATGLIALIAIIGYLIR
ncbi:MAG: hypothetical protein IPH94_06385 [Saprospiraceae bacterium]|nr:hypothetical protein [Saprospiraceae bacterium]MBK7789779.1 hypothetical protein [Saprospiraceae bacterium]MBK8112513.1 hypothetical protein [Saprospiraceae bacterium]MBK8850941.1 hypothetical protein [Saprospiraceae bacterium]MBK9688218.1 hypothetical protein [Saprospiraceae bacterium]